MTREPKYQALSERLRQMIADGMIAEGSALPTENELAARYGISRQTVRQAIAQLEQDGLVRRMRGSGTYVRHGPRKSAGVRLVNVITTYITDYIFPSIVRGAESVFSDNGVLMTLSATYNQTETERSLLERALKQGTDGLLIEGTQTALPNPNIALYEELRRRNIPFVMINGFYPELISCTRVLMDDETGGAAAANYLIDRGHKRIGGVFKSDDMQGCLRHRGFRGALENAGLRSSDESLLWFSTPMRDAFFDDPRLPFYRALPSLSAVACYNDQTAVRLIDKAREMGLSVPENLSVISFDDSALASVCLPRLTTLGHQKEALGRLAAQKLIAMIDGERQESACLPWTIVERESVRAPEKP